MPQTVPTITVDLDAKCIDCGRGGKMGNGLCLSCTGEAIQGKRLRTRQGRYIAQAIRQRMKETRGKR